MASPHLMLEVAPRTSCEIKFDKDLLLLLLCYCFTSTVNTYGHVGPVIQHFSAAGLDALSG